MKGMPFSVSGKGALESIAAQILGEEDKGGTFRSLSGHRKKKAPIFEPNSVLYNRRSSSPPTSTSTLSSSLSAGVPAAPVSENLSQTNDEWTTAADPPDKCGMGDEDWEMILSASPADLNQEQTFLRWIMGDMDDSSSAAAAAKQPAEFIGLDPLFDGGATSSSSGGNKNAIFMSQPTFFQEPSEEKPQLFSPNQALFFPTSSFGAATEQQQQQQHQNSIFPYDSACQIAAGQLQSAPYQLQQRLMKSRPSLAGDDAAAMALQQHQALTDQLFKAAELVEVGNFISAHGILARLNHHLSSPLGKPLLRSAFYFKEALQFLVANSCNPPAVAATSSPFNHHRTPFATSLFTPLDVVLKFSAYKAFSEVSPLLHFTNFTVTQALLEELGNADHIHIVDFDIGIGGHWSSFIQELSQRRRSSTSPRLKITAFVSLCAFHPLELYLTSENLSHFAADLNIPFEINISSIESFDPVEILAVSASCNETIAVNLPVGAGLNPSFSTMLGLVKQLTPKIVVTVDQGCDRSDLPFSHHFLHAFQSSMILLDSIDAAGSNLDMSNKIERFILQPKIENCIIGRYRAADKMPQWRILFASAGFVPVQFSNFTEMQAECLLKRVQVRGFHVEKRQASLYLYWQRGELVSVSVWRC